MSSTSEDKKSKKITVEEIIKIGEVDARFESPIDLKPDILSHVHLPDLEWHNAEELPKLFKIANNGDTVIMSGKWFGPRPYLYGGPFSGTYIFSQVHFHWGENDNVGSEHTVNGTGFPLEIHTSFFKTDYMTFEEARRNLDGVTVLAYLCQISENDNKNLEPLIEALDYIKNPLTSHPLKAVPYSEMLPAFKNNYIMYWGNVIGSHRVLWLVYREPIAISSRQVAKFRHIQDSHKCILLNNYRSTKSLNYRKVLSVSSDPERSEIISSVVGSENSYKIAEKSAESEHASELQENVSSDASKMDATKACMKCDDLQNDLNMLDEKLERLRFIASKDSESNSGQLSEMSLSIKAKDRNAYMFKQILNDNLANIPVGKIDSYHNSSVFTEDTLPEVQESSSNINSSSSIAKETLPHSVAKSPEVIETPIDEPALNVKTPSKVLDTPASNLKKIPSQTAGISQEGNVLSNEKSSSSMGIEKSNIEEPLVVKETSSKIKPTLSMARENSSRAEGISLKKRSSLSIAEERISSKGSSVIREASKTQSIKLEPKSPIVNEPTYESDVSTDISSERNLSNKAAINRTTARNSSKSFIERPLPRPARKTATRALKPEIYETDGTKSEVDTKRPKSAKSIASSPIRSNFSDSKRAKSAKPLEPSERRASLVDRSEKKTSQEPPKKLTVTDIFNKGADKTRSSINRLKGNSSSPSPTRREGNKPSWRY